MEKKSKAMLPKIKFPMDMTVFEHSELGNAAEKLGMNKKELIYTALKKAYNIDLEAANESSPYWS